MYKKKILCYLVVMAMLAAMIPARSEAAKVKLSTTKVTVKVGQKKTVKITGLKSKNIKKLTIKVTKGSKLVKVKKSGKTKFIIQGKKKGKATITVKSGKKTYKIKVTVK